MWPVPARATPGGTAFRADRGWRTPAIQCLLQRARRKTGDDSHRPTSWPEPFKDQDQWHPLPTCFRHPTTYGPHSRQCPYLRIEATFSAGPWQRISQARLRFFRESWLYSRGDFTIYSQGFSHLLPISFLCRSHTYIYTKARTLALSLNIHLPLYTLLKNWLSSRSASFLSPKNLTSRRSSPLLVPSYCLGAPSRYPT